MGSRVCLGNSGWRKVGCSFTVIDEIVWLWCRDATWFTQMATETRTNDAGIWGHVRLCLLQHGNTFLLEKYLFKIYWLIDWLIFRKREREHVFVCLCVCKEGRAEAKGERSSSRLPGERWAQLEAGSQDPEIMTWAEIKSQMLSWLSSPRTPP